MKKFIVMKDGKELDSSSYTWDEKTKTFSTDEDNLVLDFTNWHGVTFKTGMNCTFKTGDCCTFKTGSDCTFKTGNYCTFDTGSDCTFKTGNYCTFDTGSNCTFDTGYGCIIINRITNEVIRLDNKENYYDMKEKQVTFENITVFKNGNDLNVTLQLTQLESLRKILDKNTYFKLEKQIFKEMT